MSELKNRKKKDEKAADVSSASAEDGDSGDVVTKPVRRGGGGGGGGGGDNNNTAETLKYVVALVALLVGAAFGGAYLAYLAMTTDFCAGCAGRGPVHSAAPPHVQPHAFLHESPRTVTASTPSLSLKYPPGVQECITRINAFDPKARAIVEPSDEWYPGLAWLNTQNYNIPSLMPSVVVRVETDGNDLSAAESLIMFTLRCATTYNVSISVRSGGHSYAGFSQNPVMQMNLRGMNNVTINPNYPMGDGTTWPVAIVQGGAIFEEILSVIQPTYMMSTGLCPTVGVSAFHLGGGLGSLCRQYGMGSDNVVQFSVISANGTQKWIANNTTNPELYWALRGGGGPSFGVVTQLVIKLYPALTKFTYGEYCQSGDDIFPAMTRLGAAAINSTHDLPPWLTVHWRLTNNGTDPNNLWTGFCPYVYSLRGRDETLDALAPIIGVTYGYEVERKLNLAKKRQFKLGSTSQGSAYFFTEYDSYTDFENANAERKGYPYDPAYMDIASGTGSYVSTCVLGSLNDLQLRTTLYQLWSRTPNNPNVGYSMQGMTLGGINISATATAFPWRQQVYYASDASCSFDNAVDRKACADWLAARKTALGPLCLGSYLNFPDQNLPNYEQQYWRQNVPQLRNVRTAYNPTYNNPLNFSQVVTLNRP